MPGANMPDLDRYYQQMDTFLSDYDTRIKERGDAMGGFDQKMLGSIDNLIQQFAPEMKENFDFGKELRDIYQKDVVPATQRYMKEAEGYDTPERRAKEAARAQADVSQRAGQQEENQRDQLKRSGIDPNDPRYAKAMQADDANVAAQGAVASNQARYDVEDRGRAMRRDALQTGEQLGATGRAYTGTGAQFGQAIPNSIGAGLQQNAAVFGSEESNRAGQRNMLDNIISTRMSRWQAGSQARAAAGGGMAGGLGSAIGGIAGAAIGTWVAPGIGTAMGAQLGSSLGGGATGAAAG